jgi:hypothetical protein
MPKFLVELNDKEHDIAYESETDGAEAIRQVIEENLPFDDVKVNVLEIED